MASALALCQWRLAPTDSTGALWKTVPAKVTPRTQWDSFLFVTHVLPQNETAPRIVSRVELGLQASISGKKPV